jgi:hypothetical protein
VAPSQSASVGRSPESTLPLPAETRLADRQLQALLETRDGPPAVRLETLDARIPTLVNRKAVDGRGTARPGDVIQFGSREHVLPTAILVHYPLSSDAWPAEAGGS